MADKDFVVKNGIVTGSNTLTIGTAAYVVANGNVGIGTASPAYLLEVNGTLYSGNHSITGWVNASSGFYGTVQTATQGTINHNSLANYSSDRHIAHSGVSVSAGNGLTGGGDITTSRTISANPGNTQLIANSSGLWVDQSKIDHNSLTNYVGNRHIDHTSVSIATANGLSGGGDISSTRTLTVTAGTGVVVNATGVHVNSTYIGTLSANNTTYVNNKTEGNLNVNSAAYATNAGNTTLVNAKTEGNLNVNSAAYATNAGNTTLVNAKTEGNLNVNSASYATSAGSATNASAATNATYATSAGSATNATYATSAGSATNASAATNATYATSAGSATNASYATEAAQGATKAYARFTGTSIAESRIISSISDTGIYSGVKLNFSTTFSTSNYAVVATPGLEATWWADSQQTTYVQISYGNSNGRTRCSVVIHYR